MKKVLYHNGNIITMVEGEKNPEALLVENGRIKSVGKYADLKCGCEEYDLKGKTLLPGFIDGAFTFIHGKTDAHDICPTFRRCGFHR